MEDHDDSSHDGDGKDSPMDYEIRVVKGESAKVRKGVKCLRVQSHRILVTRVFGAVTVIIAN